MNAVASLNPAADFDSAALLEHLPALMVVLGPDGRVCYLNAAANQLLGADCLGQTWRELVQQRFLPTLNQGELQTSDNRQFNLSTSPRPDRPGQLLILSEVTSTRQMQQAMLRNRHLLTMGRMMASLAHQIRTPLSSAMLYLSQMVKADLQTGQWQRFSQQTLDRVRQIEQTINDMLTFAHGGQFHMQDFDLQSLLTALQQQLQPQFQAAFAQFHCHLPAAPLMLHGNASALSGALANLAMNALQANPQGLQLHIRVALEQEGRLLMQVQDNGPGFDSESAAHLFEPFYTTKTDGTGLGLAVVQSVITSHQGQIELDASFSGGARFLIRLPCHAAQQAQTSDSGKHHE